MVERYPRKATQAFRDLQVQLEGTENRITVARNRYVDSVAEYNKLVRFFPTNLTARFILGMEPRRPSRRRQAREAARGEVLNARAAAPLRSPSRSLASRSHTPRARSRCPIFASTCSIAADASPTDPTRARATAQRVERTSGHQVVVHITPSLEGLEIEDYSIQIADAWKVGQKNLDNGVI